MKCEATSDTTHGVLISKEIDYKSFKKICSGEPKKVNLGFNNDGTSENIIIKVENNSLVHIPRVLEYYIQGKYSRMAYFWEILSKFFSIHNIDPIWLDCDYDWGWYDEELGSWTGCMGKV